MNISASPAAAIVMGALLATVAPSQFHWPPAFAAAPGNAVMNAPFSAPPGHPEARTRCMVVIHPASLPFPPGTVLTRLSLRRDVAYPNQAYPALAGDLTVKIGRALVTPDQVHDVRFNRLWDGLPTTVYRNLPPAVFQVPAGPAPGAALPPFDIVIPFTSSFPWQGGPLAIELVFAPTAGTSTWRVDSFVTAAPRSGSSRSLGAGCRGTNSFVPFHYAMPETTMPGAQLEVQVEGLPSNGLAAFHMLGFRSLPQPLDLGQIGGPVGCPLRIEPAILLTVPTENPSALFHRAVSRVQLPALAAAVGFQLYSQWLCLDTGVSASLPFVVSDALEITLGQVMPTPAPHSARTLWMYGATVFGNDKGRMVPADHGPVLRFN
jgi:hypothetical protein